MTRAITQATTTPPTTFPSSSSSIAGPFQPPSLEMANSKINFHLEDLSTRLLLFINNPTPDFSDPILTHLSPLYRSQYNNMAIAENLDQHLHNLRSFCTRSCRSPSEPRIVLLNVSSQVDEKKGRAVVWVTHSDPGCIGDGVARESVKVMHWERGGGAGSERKWVCLGHTQLFGCMYGDLWI